MSTMQLASALRWRRFRARFETPLCSLSLVCAYKVLLIAPRAHCLLLHYKPRSRAYCS